MNNKNKHRTYEPPRVLNLSGLSVKGDHPGPLGTCVNGYYPYTGCSAGDGYTPVGTGCVDGSAPTEPKCSAFGSAANSACTGGGFAG